MNQIIFSKYNEEIVKEQNIKKRNLLIVFKYQFAIALVVIVICTFYFLNNSYKDYKKELISKQLISNFNINRLYADNDNYSTSVIEVADANKKSFIIGLIEIPSLEISYPILADVSDELLKIATCRFAGPMPNEVGNLCIAGHNYHDTRFFSNLSDLEVGDIINIYDIDGISFEYSVTKKETVISTDKTCTMQDTNGKRQITLITCANNNSYRVVITAIAN